MATIKCENGHFYDDKMFFRCPHCGIQFEFVSEKGKKIESEAVQAVRMKEDDKTELV